MNKIVLLIVCLMIGNLFYLNCADDKKDNVSFKFGFIKKDIAEKITAVDLNNDIPALNSDFYKLYFSPTQNAFIYIFLLDAQNNLSLIFPSDFNDFTKKYKNGDNLFFPNDEEDWFSIDKTKGTEKFYLLVFNSRQKNLEQMTSKYLKLSKKNNTKETQIAKQNVLDEITKIKKDNSNFIVLAEKPTPIAGTFKGIKEDIEKLAFEIQSKKFYTKTIRLTHEK